jgi:hypothetical protein
MPAEIPDAKLVTWAVSQGPPLVRQLVVTAKVLACGSFGCVFPLCDASGEACYALKVQHAKSGGTLRSTVDEVRRMFQREVHTMRTLRARDPLLGTQVLASWETGPDASGVVVWCTLMPIYDGNVHSTYRGLVAAGQGSVWVALLERVALLGRRLDELYVLHGDLKPDNVLYRRPNAEAAAHEYTLVVADFGFSLFYPLTADAAAELTAHPLHLGFSQCPVVPRVWVPGINERQARTVWQQWYADDRNAKKYFCEWVLSQADQLEAVAAVEQADRERRQAAATTRGRHPNRWPVATTQAGSAAQWLRYRQGHLTTAAVDPPQPVARWLRQTLLPLPTGQWVRPYYPSVDALTLVPLTDRWHFVQRLQGAIELFSAKVLSKVLSNVRDAVPHERTVQRPTERRRAAAIAIVEWTLLALLLADAGDSGPAYTLATLSDDEQWLWCTAPPADVLNRVAVIGDSSRLLVVPPNTPYLAHGISLALLLPLSRLIDVAPGTQLVVSSRLLVPTSDRRADCERMYQYKSADGGQKPYSDWLLKRVRFYLSQLRAATDLEVAATLAAATAQ